jgi:SPP1 family predicted phage head-tail adaptor
MIGDLRTRLGLYKPQVSADGFGGSVTSWVLNKAIWGAVEPKTLTETRKNGRLAVTQSYRVTIHFQDNFPERARLMWGERMLRVIAASDPDNRRERLHLICEEEQQ